MSGDRKVEFVTVPDWGKRDAGKVFKITEWGARRAETWAWGMVFALKGTSGEIPDDVARLGMVGVGIRLINTVLKADVNYPALKPYFDELIDECVLIVRDPTNRDRISQEPIATALMEADLAEIPTIQWLRSEVIRVHTNFSILDSLFELLSRIRSGSTDSPTTSTSPP